MAHPVESLQRDGYVILERAIDRAAIDELCAALAPFEANRPMGRNAFEGQRSQRVYSLAAKGEPFLRLAELGRLEPLPPPSQGRAPAHDRTSRRRRT